MTGRGASVSPQMGSTPDPAPYLRMVLAEQGQMFLAAVFRIVEDSYKTHPMRHRTTNEDRDRVGVVLRAFASLKRDKGFSADQAMGSVRTALRAHLDKTRFDPRCRSLYAPDPDVPFLIDAPRLGVVSRKVH